MPHSITANVTTGGTTHSGGRATAVLGPAAKDAVSAAGPADDPTLAGARFPTDCRLNWRFSAAPGTTMGIRRWLIDPPSDGGPIGGRRTGHVRLTVKARYNQPRLLAGRSGECCPYRPRQGKGKYPQGFHPTANARGYRVS